MELCKCVPILFTVSRFNMSHTTTGLLKKQTYINISRHIYEPYKYLLLMQIAYKNRIGMVIFTISS